MKKIIIICMTFIGVFLLASCQGQAASSNVKQKEVNMPEQTQQTAGKKILVVYFSHSGNTQVVAQMIARDTGATLFRIVPQNQYPVDYSSCVDKAKEEQNQNARPEIKNKVENMNEYDIIFLGYPNWWGTMPMIVWTFLESYNLEGKTIIPFCTHGGSRMGKSEKDIAKICPKCTVQKGLSISGSSVNGAAEDVFAWVQKLGLEKGGK